MDFLQTMISNINKKGLSSVILFFAVLQSLAQTPDWTVNASSYEHSMTLTSVVLDQSGSFFSDQITIGIFDGEQCVGVSTTDTYFPPIDANLAFVLIYGNAASATYQVKVYIDNEEYNAGEVNFASNAVLGTLDTPYEIQPIFEVDGCMDEDAVNYNPLAISDDGSCYYPIYGCTDQTAYNYNPMANTDDGSCEAVVIGCMDANYLEYNSEANSGFQQVLCLTPIVEGCMDPMYFEFNSTANIDNDSCEQTWQSVYIVQNNELLAVNTTIDSLNIELENCATQVSIDIISGWNLIGFVHDSPQDATVALESIQDLIIVVKNNFGDVYYPTYNFNGIGDLLPGQGYQIKTSQAIPEFQF